MTTAHIYQIYYNQDSFNNLDPGFIPLDNSANLRPDWSEYWPIRNFLLNNEIEADELYGFLSPRFYSKTSLTSTDVHDFIRANPGRDFYSFSPLKQDSVCYLNIFEHGNRYHPGLIDITQSFLQVLNIEVDFRTLVMDLETTVFCNYFVAKPVFWEKWFALTEQLFHISESNDSDLAKKIDALTEYRQRSPLNMKVFIIERIASLILALDPTISTAVFDIEKMPWSASEYIPYRNELLLINALKVTYAKTDNSRYLDLFFELRRQLLSRCDPTFVSENKKDFF